MKHISRNNGAKRRHVWAAEAWCFGRCLGDPKMHTTKGVATIAVLSLANGGDNLGIYIPLFATSTKPALTVEDPMPGAVQNPM